MPGRRGVVGLAASGLEGAYTLRSGALFLLRFSVGTPWAAGEVGVVPARVLYPVASIAVRNQGATNAATPRSISVASRMLIALKSTPSPGATTCMTANWPIPVLMLASRRAAAHVLCVRERALHQNEGVRHSTSNRSTKH